MENFIATVRSHSGSGNLHDLVEFLNKATDSLPRSNANLLNNVLETLDIQQHSLGVLAILRARLMQNPVSDWDELFNRVVIFILECNGEQIRHWAKAFADLCHLFTQQLVQRHTPMVGIPALLKAIGKIQLSETSLTSVHADVCRLCLASKCFTPATNNLLMIDYVDIAQEASQDPKHILLFFYYGGMIFTALKKFERALFYFEACVTVPTIAVSHIMMEAYNKYHLVSLIVNGDKYKLDNSSSSSSAAAATALPKYTSPIVNKYFKPLSQPYHQLVTAFYTNQTTELENVITLHSAVFENDGNLGLVRQVAVAQTKSNIKRLTKTFVTLSLTDVASRIGLNSPREAENHIVAMIQEGSIHARISQKDGMVQFDANPERFNSVRMLSELERKVSACITLNNQITQMEEDIVLNASFIKKSTGNSASAAAAAAAGGGGSSAAVVPSTAPVGGASRGPAALDLGEDILSMVLGGGGGQASAAAGGQAAAAAAPAGGAPSSSSSSGAAGAAAAPAANAVGAAAAQASNHASSNNVGGGGGMSNGPSNLH